MVAKKNTYKIIAFVFAIFLSLLCNLTLIPAFADISTYSDVLEDLQVDGSFNVNDYQPNATDYSMQVIQIAESEKKELFIYVYQPSANSVNLIASKVVLWTDFSANGKDFEPNEFELQLVSQKSQFQKYLVKDYEVSNEPYRYYNIVSLKRPFNDVIDENTVIGGATTLIAHPIGQQWCAYYYNDVLTYEMNTFDYVDITPTVTGYITLLNSYSFLNYIGSSFTRDCEVWVLGFNVQNYIVDHIYDADLVYYETIVEEHYNGSYLLSTEIKGKEDIPRKVILDEYDEMTWKGTGINSKEVSWKRILKPLEFIEQINEDKGYFSDGVESALKDSQWVFTFAETSYSSVQGITHNRTTVTRSKIEDVSILRLHFLSNGRTYNLGVVMNSVSPNTQLGNINAFEKSWFEELIGILFLLFGLLILINLLTLVSPAFKVVFKSIINLFSFVFKQVFNVLSYPFRRKSKK